MRQTGLRKGEWLELRAPGGTMEPEQWKALLLEEYRFPPKLLQRLERTEGFLPEEKRLRIRLFPDEAAVETAEWADLEVLYEDDYCLVVNKPAGMPVHPSQPGQTGTLAHAVASYYDQTGQRCRIRHIHRLDEDTTGPVLYAKNELAHILLDEAMREKSIQRIYVAIAQGRLAPAAGLIDKPIGKDRHNPKRRRITPGGDPARTRYRTLDYAEGAVLVELRLETGRTHQIRVHMQAVGAPLIGDALYGGSTRLFNRQALHGEVLEFRHPWTGEEIRVEAMLPEDFVKLWSRLKHGAKP